MIEDTSKRDPMLHLLGAMSDGTTKYLTDIETAGQRQLVNSDRLPTDLNNGTVADFEAVGFTFGDPDQRDPMFRPATLPTGWRREGSAHAMWSHILDEHGRQRVSIFYKAASYDRRAFMSLDTPYGYLSGVLYGDGEPVLDDVWLTTEVAVATLADIRDQHLTQAEEADGFAVGNSNDEYWSGRAKEHRADAKKAEAMRARVAKAVSSR